ncbi:MAG TPA: hypothetical protein PK184_09820 [Phycisphaerae bacterium]|jgi:hypothetical protein|nr:hypothetical protein [Phycisphaerae bacterium]HOL28223.1 hypothetical protein [Phycisphaerae bacterium]HPP21022.1 hypothetical protein [Phycisphaerae bacterium]HPU32984.1 hypothetical protein [Phycisphaerae bacterium]HQE19690.1 hypothetical protein [Aggregatilineales bacterium]
MRNVQSMCISGLAVMLVLNTAAGQDFSAELKRGHSLLDQLTSKPLTPRQVYAELWADDKVVGYLFIRVGQGKESPIESRVETVIQMPGMHVSGVVKVETDLKLQPRLLELDRSVRQPDGKVMTRQQSIEAKNGKLEMIARQGDRLQKQAKPLPKQPFFFSVELLAARWDLGRADQPFALHELNPDTGAPRLLVFRPSIEDDGTRVLRIFVDGANQRPPIASPKKASSSRGLKQVHRWFRRWSMKNGEQH